MKKPSSAAPAPSAAPVLPPALKLVCRALDDKKASDLTVLHVGDKSSITDYLVLATGTSQPHLRALRVEAEKVLDSAQVRILGMDTALESGWTVIDTFDVMVHLFTADKRANYRLEQLWKDAAVIDVAALLAPDPKPAAKKAAVKKAPATKAAVKKAVTKKVAAKAAPVAKKASVKKAAFKKAAVKKAAAKKAVTKPVVAKKAVAKKAVAKKAAKKSVR